jgi:DNA-binding transcriptional LysR family regulator
MDWNDIRYFLALARLGSVRSAGASLGVSHSTVARRIEALEAQLAARLFDRNRDGYTLTEAGQQMRPGAERIEREMSSLERGLVGQDERLSGVISITCCDNYIAGLLLRILKPLCHSYPEIELHLTTDSRLFDLSKREADLAIRALSVEAQPPEHLIGVKLAPLKLANYVATAHAPRLDPDCVGAAPRWASFEDRALQEQMIETSSYPNLSAWGAFSALELLVRAAREGVGLVMLPTYVGDTEPALRRLAHPDLRHVGDLWLLSHPDLRDNARFRVARTRLIEGVKTYEALFRGEGWPKDAPDGPEIAPGNSGGRCVQ